MHRNTELKRFTNSSCFNTRAYAAPERRIKQHHIDRRIENIRSELFEINYNRIRRQGHANFLTDAPHSVHTKHGIFKIIIANAFDLLTKPDCRLGGPHAIRIKAKAIAVECSGKRTIAFELIFGTEYSSLQLM